MNIFFSSDDYESPKYPEEVRGKSIIELSVTTFLPDWQPSLIFVWFVSKFLCMCSKSMASAHVILKYRTRAIINRGYYYFFWKDMS